MFLHVYGLNERSSSAVLSFDGGLELIWAHFFQCLHFVGVIKPRFFDRRIPSIPQVWTLLARKSLTDSLARLAQTQAFKC